MIDRIHIERMRKSHLTEVLDIERASFSTPWSEWSFIHELHNPASSSVVAVLDDAVVGFLITSQVLDEGHILDLAIRPERRRRGIAEALVREALREMRELGLIHVYLEVRASNGAAIGLYEKLGFNVEGTRKDYYQSPKEDAVIMSIKL